MCFICDGPGGGLRIFRLQRPHPLGSRGLLGAVMSVQRRCLDVVQQAARVGTDQMHLCADGGRRRPESDEIGHGGQRSHEVGAPSVSVGLDVLPEVSLGTLRSIDQTVGGVSQGDHLRNREIDAILDGEEDSLISLISRDSDSLMDLLAVGQQTSLDAAIDERRSIDGADVEGHVGTVPQHVDDAVDVRTGDLELGDAEVEVLAGFDQSLLLDAEVGSTVELDELLDAHVTEHQLVAFSFDLLL